MSEESSFAVEEFEATFRNVLLPMGLRLDAVKLRGKGAKIQEEPFALKLEEPGTILVDIGQANLQEFLEKESPGGLRDFEVKIEGQRLHISATAKVVIDIRAKATCTLEIVDERQLWVRLEDVEVLGVGARRLVEKQLEKVNPVLDVANFPMNITLEKVNAEGGELILIGKANP